MINKVILIGNLGRDPEVRTTPSGQTVASFSIATTRKWRDKDGARQEQTEWHNIVVWGRSAEVAGQYLTKGKQIYVEGRLQTRSWDDRTSGEKRYRTEIVCENFQMLGTAGGGGGGGGRPEGGGRYDGGGRGEARHDSGPPGGGFGPEPDLGDFGGDDDDIPF